jgi:hypothetical protein
LQQLLGRFGTEAFGGFEDTIGVRLVAVNFYDPSGWRGLSVIDNDAIHEHRIEPRFSRDLSDDSVVVFREDVNQYFHSTESNHSDFRWQGIPRGLIFFTMDNTSDTYLHGPGAT